MTFYCSLVIIMSGWSPRPMSVTALGKNFARPAPQNFSASRRWCCRKFWKVPPRARSARGAGQGATWCAAPAAARPRCCQLCPRRSLRSRGCRGLCSRARGCSSTWTRRRRLGRGGSRGVHPQPPARADSQQLCN